MNALIPVCVLAGLLGVGFIAPARAATSASFQPAASATAVPSSAAPVPSPSTPQSRFATPEDGAKALLSATQAHDKTALRAIFGPEGRDLVSGDKVEDANAAARFAEAIAQLCRLTYVGDDKVILNIGAQDWPFPIPLVKSEGQWIFDTAAGKEEIINRRVGENELIAIGVCRTYAAAQREYASEDRDGSGVLKYAQKIKSSPGHKDGLYWEAAAGDPASPFGPLVASARAEGYGPRREGEAPRPFHGYFFRILTGQGPHAPGGQYDYIINGNMIGGFALVAHPARWGDSGIMTFIVNQQGKVYQRDFGPDTAAEVAALTKFDPDDSWTQVPRP